MVRDTSVAVSIARSALRAGMSVGVFRCSLPVPHVRR